MVTLVVFAMMVHLTTLTCFHPLQKRLVQIENSGPMINLKLENGPILKKIYLNTGTLCILLLTKFKTRSINLVSSKAEKFRPSIFISVNFDLSEEV